MGQQCVAMLGYKALAITVLISRIAGAQIDNVHVVLDASTTVGPLEHFWESTGFCPPDPHQDFYKFIFTNDEIQNLAYIGSVPKQGIKQVRIHWLLDLVSVEKTAVEQLVVYNFTYLDRAMKLLIDNGLKPGFELMGNPSNFFSDFDDTKQIYAWRDLIASLAKHMIGIVTQETNGPLAALGDQYLVAVYVKFLESAGARAAPVFVNSSMEEVERMFHSLNGVILPGGHVKLNQSGYTAVGRKFLELAIKAYDETGEVFPIWGECLGLELVAMIVSGRDLSLGQYDQSFLSLTDARNISLKLDLPSDYKLTKLLGSAPDHIIGYLTEESINYNNHFRGITPETFQKDEKLREFFQIVSTNKDKKGKVFISTMEARRYPFYMFQWHPAKPQFEWSPVKDISHTQEAILASQYWADFFVNQARLSSHRFPNRKEEKAALMYKYNPVYTGDVITMLQCYFW